MQPWNGGFKNFPTQELRSVAFSLWKHIETRNDDCGTFQAKATSDCTSVPLPPPFHWPFRIFASSCPKSKSADLKKRDTKSDWSSKGKTHLQAGSWKEKSCDSWLEWSISICFRENKALIRPGCCGKSSISSHPTGWHSDLESTSPEQGAVDLQQHTATKKMCFLHLPTSSWVGENNVAQKIVNR